MKCILNTDVLKSGNGTERAEQVFLFSKKIQIVSIVNLFYETPSRHVSLTMGPNIKKFTYVQKSLDV